MLVPGGPSRAWSDEYLQSVAQEIDTSMMKAIRSWARAVRPGCRPARRTADRSPSGGTTSCLPVARHDLTDVVREADAVRVANQILNVPLRNTTSSALAGMSP